MMVVSRNNFEVISFAYSADFWQPEFCSPWCRPWYETHIRAFLGIFTAAMCAVTQAGVKPGQLVWFENRGE